jgi:hypothetical protein
MPSLPPSGPAERLRAQRRAFVRRCAGALVVAAAVSVGGCRFSPYKFQGGGLPPNIRTMAVLPFENDTPVPELQRELFEAMRRELQNRLNLRDASEAKADAIVRGTIVRYDIDVPVGFSSDPTQATTARRQLQLVVDVAIIDQGSGRTLWEKKGLTAKGEYAEQNEAGGRRQAIDEVIADIIEGATSQW